MAKARQFNEFLPAILVHPPNGDVVTVIGGQAVNYWCEQAAESVPELAAFRPFTSEDLDVVARQKAQTLAIARATKLKLIERGQGYAGTDRAAFVDANGDTVIQVLGGMYGVTDRALERDTARVRIRDTDGVEHVAKIANRTVLIRGKIALALASDGIRCTADREHDRFHLKLLILCLAAGTRDLLDFYEGDDRAIIKTLKALLKIISGKDAKAVAALDPLINWKRAIAPEILSVKKDQHPRLYHYIAGEVQPWLNDQQL